MAPDQQEVRPRALVIAGFDQSGGAGILADIKTMEAHDVYGYAVCTGLTFQNEREIADIHWYSEKEIFQQVDLCFQSEVRFGGEGSRPPFEWVKIGIGRSIPLIRAIIRHLRQHNPAVKVILDPVIKASSGREFWEGTDKEGLEELASLCYLMTPNWEEVSWLYPGADVMKSSEALASICHLYLKGGHNPKDPGRDYLWEDGQLLVLESGLRDAVVYAKHGSGCVLSSSLTANLAAGHSLMTAAERGKRYIEQFLTSNKTQLGWHRPLKIEK